MDTAECEVVILVVELVEVLDCSMKDGGLGLQSVMTWIQQNVKLSSSSSS